MSVYQAMYSEIERLKKAIGEQTEAVKKWRNRAHSLRQKRNAWMKRALEAERKLNAYQKDS